MNYFNIKELESLKEYERYFYTSVHLKYKSATKHLFNLRLQEIYENHTGVKEKINWSCPKCAFDYYKKVGQLYYASIENTDTVGEELEPALKINNLDQTVTNTETNDEKRRIRESNEKTQKKRGRQRKQ